MSLSEIIHQIREPLHLLQDKKNQQTHLVLDSQYQQTTLKKEDYFYFGFLPALYPEWLGSPLFLQKHQVRFPYIVGEMANGIATAKMVIAAVKAGMVGFFGAAGLMPAIIEKNLQEIMQQLNGQRGGWGSNLIHSPQEPHLEEAAVDLYLRYQIERVSASAYMKLTPAIVYYACKGLSLNPQGNIHRKNYVIAKISRPEVALQFMSPAPIDMLQHLLQRKLITEDEARLASQIPLAEDITIEADSGGHTDNRPLTALFPTIQTLAEKLKQQYQYKVTFRLGAAGGLGTPDAVAAAFSLGADYVLTGTINQAAVESGLSVEAKKLLLNADIADMMMAPAADMFELGVKLQVLKRGTLFGLRANKLYDVYTRYESLESVPVSEKEKIEKQILNASLETIWMQTQQFFSTRDPKQLELANKDPKHKMALTFRWYLGLSSQWAIQGDLSRKMDYQIWCGPAMGAFNAWAAGTFLEPLENRTVAQIGLNLLEGAAVLMRAQQLRHFGFSMSSEKINYKPTLLH